MGGGYQTGSAYMGFYDYWYAAASITTCNVEENESLSNKEFSVPSGSRHRLLRPALLDGGRRPHRHST